MTSSEYGHSPGRNLPIQVKDSGSRNVQLTKGSDEALLQFITFQIGGEEYGVDILTVREIIGWTEVTKLPNIVEYVRGVLNLRGVIVPVIDLSCQFGMGLTDVTPTHVIIVFLVDGKFVGILVDSVSEILSLNSIDISPIPETGLIVTEEFLRGLATTQGRMVTIIDVERLFDPSILQKSNELTTKIEQQVD